MTDVDNTFGTITLHCDEIGCDQEETFEGFDGQVDFTSMSREAREQGWKITRDDGDWIHYCPTHADRNQK